MINLIPAEIRRQVGRKGSFWGSMGWIGIFAIGTLVWALVGNDPDGATAVDNGGGLIMFATILASIVIAATAGAYDVDQGTMRYLVLTGRPRWQLVLVRVPALLVTIVLVSLPAILIVLLAGAVAPSPGPGSGDVSVFDLFYGTWMAGLLYGLLGLTIGTFLKSNGVAIAVAVVGNFAGVLIAGLLYEFVSQDLGKAFYPVVAGVVIDLAESTDPAEPTFSVAASAVILLVWIAGLLAAAIARVQRTEY